MLVDFRAEQRDSDNVKITVAIEVAYRDRLVFEDAASVCFAPYASRSPFELWIVPRHHESDFGRATDEQLTGLVPIAPGDLIDVKGIVDAQTAIENIYSNFGYFQIQVAPVPEPDAQAGVADIRYVINENALIISGALVGAAGLILTNIMCKAMNRSLANVIFGSFGQVAGKELVKGEKRTMADVNDVQADDVAMLLAYAKQVVIVPGYGLAVAQAQHKLRELCDNLESRGVTVKYVVHPVAGRMPGHMNVLLAEANVPYNQLYEPEDVNPDIANVDACLVVGANDVVNPAARDEPASDLYGMPIIEVDRSKHTVVMKRSLNPGFAGLDNELFYLRNTMMLFGDAADSIGRILEEVKQL